MTRRGQGPRKVQGGGKGHTGGSRGRRGRCATDRPFGAPKPGLFRDILLAPDRERFPGALPVVSFRDDDEEAFLTELERRSVARYVLSRRGVGHGSVAELRPDGLLPPRPRRRRREALQAERWCAASPLVLPGVVAGVCPGLAASGLGALREELARPAGLRAWLERRAAELAPRFRVRAQVAERFDPERDIARVLVAAADGPDDLWLKVGRLSTYADDRSLRLRVSFGREGDDDASHDHARHALVAELARRVVPGAAALGAVVELRALLERLVGTPVATTQHIAYWNAPEGGARFHHDAFHEEDGGGQHGVAYAQLAGRTVWLALSIEDLAARVREFLGWLAEGDVPWLRAELAGRWAELRTLAADRASLLGQLALPACGAFGAVVDRPEFTCFLADAGQAVVLHAGDAILLPSHGLTRTALHSVFCGSEQPTYGLSVAIRSVPVNA